jgi:hypothetical protein
MKKDEVVISTDKEQLRGVLLAWVKDSGFTFSKKKIVLLTIASVNKRTLLKKST